VDLRVFQAIRIMAGRHKNYAFPPEEIQDKIEGGSSPRLADEKPSCPGSRSIQYRVYTGKKLLTGNRIVAGLSASLLSIKIPALINNNLNFRKQLILRRLHPGIFTVNRLQFTMKNSLFR
jgi:hypothetical protein